jgi:hypothetical protein
VGLCESCQIERISMPDHPDNWRRALTLLASLEEGSTVARLLARGFSSATIAGLVEAGLVSATTERMLAGQRTIVVRRFTDRGRATLGTMTMAIDRFVLKMQLRKALGLIKRASPARQRRGRRRNRVEAARGARRCRL